MKHWFVLALVLLLCPRAVDAQWMLAGGSPYFPTTPVAIGDQAHPSIAFGVRQLNITTLTGPGQRGISSEAMFNSEANVYVAGIHSLLQFWPGTYTIPNAYRMRAVDETPLPSGVTLTNLFGLRIYDVMVGRNNWALYTGAGRVSFGDHVDVRGGYSIIVEGAPGYRAVTVGNGGIIGIFNGSGVEVGRLQGTAEGTLLSVYSGSFVVDGPARFRSLATGSTRPVYADASGRLVTQ